MAAYALLIALQLSLVAAAWLVCPFGLITGALLQLVYLLLW